MTMFVPLLAHIGVSDNPWIGVLTVSAWVLLVVLALHVARRLELDSPGDLLLPFAAVVLVAGLTGSLGDAINDQGPWAVPLGLVALVALLVAAFSDVSLRLFNRALTVTAVAAVVSVAVLMPVLEYAFFGDGTDDAFTLAAVTWYWEDGYGQERDALLLPEPDDAQVTAEVVEPLDDDGRFAVRVTLQGASFNDNRSVGVADDPEEGVLAKFPVGPVVLNPPVPQDCAEQERCTEAVFELTLPPGISQDPPTELEVELLTSDGRPFAPPVLARYSLGDAAG